MASVIHGFFYNKDIFKKLNLEVPQTKAEFMQVLEAVKKDGRYVPIAMGTADMWETATMGFQNIGPNNWKGEEGRQALLKGTAKFTDEPYIKTWEELASWAPYLPRGYQAVKYSDAQQLFTLGKAAIYPAGSWEIWLFEKDAAFDLGIFPPPVDRKGDTVYISDHTDIALGMNAATRHPDEAKKFLEWMTTSEFASLYSNAVAGFFTLSNHRITLKDPLANEFLSWRKTCKSTIRNSYQILSRGDQFGAPNLENDLWQVSAAVMNGTMTPEEAGKLVQDHLDKWYKPAK
jgi:raffinose/stachyose/melibiose transport system substrate-binding protein